MNAVSARFMIVSLSLPRCCHCRESLSSIPERGGRRSSATAPLDGTRLRPKSCVLEREQEREVERHAGPVEHCDPDHELQDEMEGDAEGSRQPAQRPDPEPDAE